MKRARSKVADLKQQRWERYRRLTPQPAVSVTSSTVTVDVDHLRAGPYTFQQVREAVHSLFTTAACYPERLFIDLSTVFSPNKIFLLPADKVALLEAFPVVQAIVNAFSQPVNGPGCLPILAASVLEALSQEASTRKAVWHHPLRPLQVLMQAVERNHESPFQHMLIPAIGEFVGSALPDAMAYDFIPRLTEILATSASSNCRAEVLTCFMLCVRELGYHTSPKQLDCFISILKIAGDLVLHSLWREDSDVLHSAVVLLNDLAATECEVTKDSLIKCGILHYAKTLIHMGGTHRNCAMYMLSSVLTGQSINAVHKFLEDSDLSRLVFSAVLSTDAVDDEGYFAMRVVRACFPTVAMLVSAPDLTRHIASRVHEYSGASILAESVAVLSLDATEAQDNMDAVAVLHAIMPPLDGDSCDM